MIKFRAWDKFYECMVTPKGFELENGKIAHVIEELPDEIVKSSITYYELMQSTGLKDKNGTEIFEGDIISCEIETIEKFIICEQCGCFGIRDKVDGFISLNSINETLSINKEFEIIGNIYKHPYLL